MIISFSKYNAILHFIIGMIISIVFNRYIYGSVIIVYSSLIAAQFLFKNEDFFFPYLQYTKIPAYVLLSIIIILSLFVTYKSTTTELKYKLLTTSQLSVSIFMLVLLNYLKPKYQILNSDFINYSPILIFLGYLISVSIISDNQMILSRSYSKLMYNLEEKNKIIKEEKFKIKNIIS